jgi:hypothetical protein
LAVAASQGLDFKGLDFKGAIAAPDAEDPPGGQDVGCLMQTESPASLPSKNGCSPRRALRSKAVAFVEGDDIRRFTLPD